LRGRPGSRGNFCSSSSWETFLCDAKGGSNITSQFKENVFYFYTASVRKVLIVVPAVCVLVYIFVICPVSGSQVYNLKSPRTV
jgi:hypothetical protein